MTQPFTIIGINRRNELQTPRYTVAFNRYIFIAQGRRRQSAIELKRKPHTAQAPK